MIIVVGNDTFTRMNGVEETGVPRISRFWGSFSGCERSRLRSLQYVLGRLFAGSAAVTRPMSQLAVFTPSKYKITSEGIIGTAPGHINSFRLTTDAILSVLYVEHQRYQKRVSIPTYGKERRPQHRSPRPQCRLQVW